MSVMEENKKTQINLIDIFLVCLRKWYLFAISIILCVGFAYYRYAITPLVYRSDATIIIKDPSNTRSTVQLDNYSNLINHVNMSNEVLQLKSKQLMTDVVKSIDADISYTIPVRLRDIELYDRSPVRMKLFRTEDTPDYFSMTVVPMSKKTLSVTTYDDTVLSVPIGDTLQLMGARVVFCPTSYYTEYLGREISITKKPLEKAAATFLSKMKVSQAEIDGTILQLSLQDYSLSRANDILNTLVDKYNEDAVREKNRIADNTAAFINERLYIIQEELGNVEGVLAQFKSSQHIMDVNEAASQYLEESKEYNLEIIKLETRLRLADYWKDYLKSAFSNFNPIPVNTGLEDATIDSAIEKYNEVVFQRNRLVRGSSNDSPAVKQVESNIIPAQDVVIGAINNLCFSLNSKINDLSALEQKSLDKFSTMPATARMLLSIERQQKIKEALYIFLLNKREENALTQSMVDNNARMIDSAAGIQMPIYPKRNQILLLGFLIGLFIPAVILISRLFVDRKIHVSSDINSSIPFLSEIPLLKRKKRICVHNKKANPVISPEYNETSSRAFREAMRMVCTNINFAKPEGCKSAVLMTTSFSVGVGKSFLASNLAACLADAQKKVIIIDADLRKRTISQRFDINHNVTGLTHYLVDTDITSSDVIIPSICPGIDFIPAGQVPPNPTELLSRVRLENLISELKSKYDFIIMDGAPVNMVADTVVLGRLVDITIFVLRSGITDQREMPFIETIVKEGRLKNLNIVLNGVDPKHSYRNPYGYGYGYGYYGES